MAELYGVVMAGGRGERFWPLSEEARTKPFVPLLGSSTLVQETVRRLEPLIPPDRILISIGEAHRAIAREQLSSIPEENFIVEPVGRDTAASIGYSALHIEQRDPDAVMLAVPADHYIGDAVAYRATLEEGVRCLDRATAIVFGVRPTRPDPGYGYIQARPPEAGTAWPVIRFVEKPDLTTATAYVESGNYFWNSGIFLWSNRRVLELFGEHMPETYRALTALRLLLGDAGAVVERSRIFSGLRRISIDFGVLEKTSGLALVPVDFPWDDVGNWTALERAIPPDAAGNVAHGSSIALDSSGCVVYSDAGPVATFGVSDLVIVQAHGKVLVCAKDRASDLKRLVTALAPGPAKEPGR